MNRILCVLLVLATPVFIVAGTGEDVRKEFKALQGTWKTVALEAAGKPFPKENIPDFTFIIGADGKSIGRSPQGEYRSTISVDPTKKPKTMDNVHESGTQKGKKQFGVYKLEGDKLTVCMTAPGAKEIDRPKDFNSKDSTGVVFVFERVKEAKKP
jgi:uncharacterized protein (TIGR03067 family)